MVSFTVPGDRCGAPLADRALRPEAVERARRSRDDVLKVLDFGIARLIDASREDHPTRTIALTHTMRRARAIPARTAAFRSMSTRSVSSLSELLTGQRLGVAAKNWRPPRWPIDAAQPPAACRAAILARQLSGDLDAIMTMATEGTRPIVTVRPAPLPRISSVTCPVARSRRAFLRAATAPANASAGIALPSERR
jgi:hypothetical protein